VQPENANSPTTGTGDPQGGLSAAPFGGQREESYATYLFSQT
jgi:hypothetical protein